MPTPAKMYPSDAHRAEQINQGATTANGTKENNAIGGAGTSKRPNNAPSPANDQVPELALRIPKRNKHDASDFPGLTANAD